METKQKECEICGVWFTPSRSSQKYCPECGKDSTKAWRDLHKHMQYSVARVGTGRPVSKTEVECKYCHKTFTCYNGVTSAYCSKACEAADRIQNTFCACCGKPMLETDDQRDTGWHNWYCSAECREKYLMDAARRNGTLKICPNCGKEFVKDSVFCCNACYQEDRAKKKEYTKYLRDNGLKVCEECGKEFSGLGKFCSAECEALHKDKEPHAYKNCVICHKTFFCPASEMMAPLCSDSCRQEYNRKQEQNKKKAKQIKMVSAAELKAKKKAAAEEVYC